MSKLHRRLTGLALAFFVSSLLGCGQASPTNDFGGKAEETGGDPSGSVDTDSPGDDASSGGDDTGNGDPSGGDEGTPGGGDANGTVDGGSTGDSTGTGDAGTTGDSTGTGDTGSTDGGTGDTGSGSTGTGTTEPAGTLDREGIVKVYADDPSQASQQWFLGERGLSTSDKRLGFKGTVKSLGGGVFQITPTTSTNPASARVYVGTTNPNWNNQSVQLAGGADWRTMIRNGYMVGPEDYKDTEVTAYYKITKSSDKDEMTFYWRGGAHPSADSYPLQCIAVCMKAQIQMKDISPRAAKEYDHYNSPAGYAWNDTVPPRFDLRSELGGSMVGKLLGQKLVMYNVKDSAGNVTAVKMELYVDTGSKDLAAPDPARQNWRLFAEYTDTGRNWPDPKEDGYIAHCHATKGQLMTWGGPYIALRLDNNVWNLHKLSIRPIVPTKLQ